MMFNMPLSTIFQLYPCRSVLLVKETGVPGENHRQVTDKIYHIMYVVCIMYRVHLSWAEFELTTLVMIGTDYISSCKPNYHMTTTSTTPDNSHCRWYEKWIKMNGPLSNLCFCCIKKGVKWSFLGLKRVVSLFILIIFQFFLSRVMELYS